MPLAFVLLTLAVLAVWAPPLKLASGRTLPVWIALFAASIAAAFASSIVSLVGLAAIAVFCAVVYGIRVVHHRWLRYTLSLLCAAMAIALSMHLVPGFATTKIIDSTRLSSDSLPFKLAFNFDKGIVGLLLLAWLCKPIASWDELRKVALRSILVGLPAAFGVMAVAWSLGYVRWAPKLPEFALAFLWSNLFLTCLAEETFFRGWLQERWMQLSPSNRLGSAAAIFLSALLFGLVHLPGGGTLALLAGLSGLVHAGAYAKFRQVEIPILTHFAVNAIHFLMFTYPKLQ